MRHVGPCCHKVTGWYHPSACFCNSTAPQSLLGCISLQQEWFSVISESQNGSCHTHLFQCFESLQGIFWKWHPLWLPAGPFLSQVFIKWLCNVCKPLDEPSVVAHQTKKGIHLQCKFEVVHILQLLSSSSYWSHPILWDSMCQIGDFFSKKVALWWLQFQIVFSNQSKMTCISSEGVLQPSVRRWLCCQGRWGNISGSVPQGNFALATEM